MTARTIAIWTATAATAAFVLAYGQRCAHGESVRATAHAHQLHYRSHDRGRRRRRG